MSGRENPFINLDQEKKRGVLDQFWEENILGGERTAIYSHLAPWASP